MTSATTLVPPSPGFRTLRKSSKPHPSLPLSAFTPPNSGISDSFPLPPSPSTVHPEIVIDANVTVLGGDLNLTQWKKEVGQVLGGRIGGVVLSLPDADIEKAIEKLGSGNSVPIISLVVPLNLGESGPTIPSYLTASSVPTSFSTAFTRSTPEVVRSLRWALEHGRPVDIDIQAPLSYEVLETLEDTISKATAGLSKVPPIILSNVLPPPDDLALPLVKLINHPTYEAFQSQTAALSLFPDVYVKFLPPSWDAPTPATPSAGASGTTVTKQKNEWKRRIKMYLGPVMEAFGYQRIIFGSSPPLAFKGSSVASDWYEIARESLAELGVEQESVDAVFYGNARKVYGSN